MKSDTNASSNTLQKKRKKRRKEEKKRTKILLLSAAQSDGRLPRSPSIRERTETRHVMFLRARIYFFMCLTYCVQCTKSPPYEYIKGSEVHNHRTYTFFTYTVADVEQGLARVLAQM